MNTSRVSCLSLALPYNTNAAGKGDQHGKKTKETVESPQCQRRMAIACCMAAAFRLAAKNEWNEAVANHFSLATSKDGKNFLMNPRWMHFSRIRARDLMQLNAEDKSTMERPDAPDLTAWSLHGRLHAVLPQARCIIHLHPAYSTVIASLADPEIKPIDQNTARFFNRVAFDMDYGGMANTDDEGERIARNTGNSNQI